MESRIRKISIAKGYITDDIMNYVVGNKAHGDFKIAEIEKDGDDYIILIKNSEHELVEWKRFNKNVALSIENSLDYGSEIDS